jgi:hypothetical protein
MHTGFWWCNLKARGCLDDLGIDGRVILKWILTWTEFIWLRIRTRVRLL